MRLSRRIIYVCMPLTDSPNNTKYAGNMGSSQSKMSPIPEQSPPPTARKEHRDADKSLARPTSLSILFDGDSISFAAGLVTYINSTNIPPIMIINRIYENQKLLSL